MSTQQEIIDGIITMLKADTVLSDYDTGVYDRVYELQPPKSPLEWKLPLIIVNIVDDIPKEAISGDMREMTIQTDLYARRNTDFGRTDTQISDARTLNNRIKTVLNRKAVNDENGCVCQNVGQATVEGNAYRITAQYKVFAEIID